MTERDGTENLQISMETIAAKLIAAGADLELFIQALDKHIDEIVVENET